MGSVKVAHQVPCTDQNNDQSHLPATLKNCYFNLDGKVRSVARTKSGFYKPFSFQLTNKDSRSDWICSFSLSMLLGGLSPQKPPETFKVELIVKFLALCLAWGVSFQHYVNITAYI